MPQFNSCLLALALAVGSALVTIPSHAQTATTNRDIIASSKTSVTNESTTNSNKSTNLNQDKSTIISQSNSSSTTVNTQKEERPRNFVYSRIGFGLKQ
ncbi:MAG: hypothetical protein MJK14_05330 [Rivularia sp. ALOHA_DT_140]|nr:hypothetical protein [Rivularia sp. ALOHA_DT_140]